MPTGVPMHDAQRQLFDAADRILLRTGPSGLTSRAVTTEAGVAKGVLHRHFPDFDAFLAALLMDRIQQVEAQSEALTADAGNGIVIDNLTDALVAFFSPVVVAAVRLVIAREDVLRRLRDAGSSGMPLLTEGTRMVADYLAAEHDLGRVTGDADVRALAPSLIGAAHLKCTEVSPKQASRDDLRRLVVAVVGSSIRA